jgi:hypothetical protein
MGDTFYTLLAVAIGDRREPATLPQASENV